MRRPIVGNQHHAKGLYRRHFLRGAGGFALALPLLPSLYPRRVLGQPADNARTYFAALTTEHGGINVENMYPLEAPNQQVELYADHTIQHGPLQARDVGNKRSLAPVLTAADLSDRLVGKMNVLRGLDIPFYISHHSGGHLGNYSERNDHAQETPTIDQVMAWSDGFYRNGDPFRQRALTLGRHGNFSYSYTNPAAKAGGIQEVSPEDSSRAAFDKLFAGGVPSDDTPQVQPRKPVVERVLENYRGLRNGNRRLSANDRQRLDDHMSRLNELERKLDTPVAATASCKDVQTPTADSRSFDNGGSIAEQIRRYQLYNDVIAAAFICGLTRVAAVRVTGNFSEFNGSWHQDVAHQHTDPPKQTILWNALQVMFENVFVDLANKLDVGLGNGRTLLDDSLVQWTQESGRRTHNSDSIPVVTAGSAADFFKTGNYVDYRNRSPVGHMHNSNHTLQKDGYTGLLYNRWLANALKSMRVPDSDWKRSDMHGYGIHPGIQGQFVWDGPLYNPAVEGSSDQLLPIIT